MVDCWVFRSGAYCRVLPAGHDTVRGPGAEPRLDAGAAACQGPVACL